MKRTILGMAEAGEALISAALEAQDHYREAKKARRPTEEVERLRILADSLVQTVTDYQLLADEANTNTRH